MRLAIAAQSRSLKAGAIRHVYVFYTSHGTAVLFLIKRIPLLNDN